MSTRIIIRYIKRYTFYIALWRHGAIFIFKNRFRNYSMASKAMSGFSTPVT